MPDPPQQILEHMNESGVYSESDLAPFHRRLTDLRNIVQADKSSGKHHDAMTKLLERELNQCGPSAPVHPSPATPRR
jgi:hypothetical protein